jgi:hypothetical protein
MRHSKHFECLLKNIIPLLRIGFPGPWLFGDSVSFEEWKLNLVDYIHYQITQSDHSSMKEKGKTAEEHR